MQVNANLNLTFTSGNESATITGTIVSTLVNNAHIAGEMSTSVSSTEIPNIAALGGNPGYAAFFNNDATNNISLSLNSNGSAPFCTLLPKQPAVLPLATAAVYAIASAGTPVLSFLMCTT